MVAKKAKKKAASPKGQGVSQNIIFSPKISVEQTQNVKQDVLVKVQKDWAPFLAWAIAVIVIAAIGYIAFQYFFPAQLAPQDELVGTYGPYDVYKADDHDYYMQINPEVIWHFRANPLDTVSIPVFPFKKDFKAALKQDPSHPKEVWIAVAPEEDVRVVVSAIEISKTLGAQRYEVHQGWLSQPAVCLNDTTNPVCSQMIVPLEFANENRTVFRILGPKDNVDSEAIYVMGNNIVVQGTTYDGLDKAADKAVLMMLNLA